MLCIKTPGGTFNFRTVGIALHDNHLLLHRADHIDFWALPGGRVELMETAEAALVREMQEELAVSVDVERLLYLVENFFIYEGRRCHEIGMYFLMRLPLGSHLLDTRQQFYAQEDNGINFTFRWFPLEKLPALEVYPLFLRENFHPLPVSPVHIVHNEIEES